MFKLIKELIKKGMILMSEIWSGVEVTSMSVIYSNLIVDGVYTFKRVPKYWKSDVAVVLISLGAEELITDATYLAEAKERIAEAEQQE